VFRPDLHRSELVEAEALTPEPDPLLDEEERTRRVKPDCHRDCQPQRQAQQEAEATQGEVDHALEMGIVGESNRNASADPRAYYKVVFDRECHG